MSSTVQEENATFDAARAGQLAPPTATGLQRWQNVNPWAVRLTVVAIFLVFWELGARQMNPIFMAAPTAIVGAFVDMLRSGELLKALASSAQALVAGYVLAAIVGLEPHELLFGGKPAVGEGKADWAQALGAPERTMVDAYLSLPTSQRKLVRDLVASLARAYEIG